MAKADFRTLKKYYQVTSLLPLSCFAVFCLCKSCYRRRLYQLFSTTFHQGCAEEQAQKTEVISRVPCFVFTPWLYSRSSSLSNNNKKACITYNWSISEFLLKALVLVVLFNLSPTHEFPGSLSRSYPRADTSSCHIYGPEEVWQGRFSLWECT